MKTIGMFTVSDKIANIITNNIEVHPDKPMVFMINDGMGKQNRMYGKFMELEKYFTKQGIEVTVIGYGKEYPSYGKLEVYISDPLAGSIEYYLKEIGVYKEAV